MKFKYVYLGFIVVTLLGFIFLMFFRDKAVYILYGYDPGLIGRGSREAYEAFDKTLFARQVLYYLIVGSTAVCLVFSCVAVYFKVYVEYYFSHFIFLICVILIGLYTIASVIPRRGL